MEDTLMIHEGVDPVILSFSWLIRWKGTMELITWVVQQSRSETDSIFCTQVLDVRLSVGCPNSSKLIRSISSGLTAIWLENTLGQATSTELLLKHCNWSCFSWLGNSKANFQFSISLVQNSLGRTIVCAALLMRISNFSTFSLMQLIKEVTCTSDRKSHWIINSWDSQLLQSGQVLYRSRQSLGKREVTKTVAPSRSNFSEIQQPILIRPPVTRALRPRRLAVWLRFWRLIYAHGGQREPQKEWISVQVQWQI